MVSRGNLGIATRNSVHSGKDTICFLTILNVLAFTRIMGASEEVAEGMNISTTETF